MVGAMDPAEGMTPEKVKQRLDMAKGFRTAGQAVFLILTVVWVLFVANAYRKTLAARLSNRARTACYVFSVIGLFLMVRGVFGVLQSAIWKLSYYNEHNYDANGFTTEFVAVENVLAVMPEFVAYVCARDELTTAPPCLMAAGGRRASLATRSPPRARRETVREMVRGRLGTRGRATSRRSRRTSASMSNAQSASSAFETCNNVRIAHGTGLQRSRRLIVPPCSMCTRARASATKSIT
jgi:hypothetical protein